MELTFAGINIDARQGFSHRVGRRGPSPNGGMAKRRRQRHRTMRVRRKERRRRNGPQNNRAIRTDVAAPAKAKQHRKAVLEQVEMPRRAADHGR